MKTHIFPGLYKTETEILYTWDGKHLYEGRLAQSPFDIILTFDGRHVYSGKYVTDFDIIYTWDGERLLKGDILIQFLKSYILLMIIIFIQDSTKTIQLFSTLGMISICIGGDLHN
jgi:hypothetical protein